MSPDDAAGNNQLVLIDPTTGAETQISGTIDSNGELSRGQSALGNHHYYFYLSSSSGDAILEQLYSADLSTTPVTISAIGSPLVGNVGGLQYDSISGTLYACVSPDDTAGNNQLVLIDPTTGAETQISGTIDSNGELSRDQSVIGNHHYYFYLSSSSGDAILEQLYSADLSTIPVIISAIGSPLVGNVGGLEFIPSTITAITADVNPQIFGSNVTFTAHVAPGNGSGNPTGTVTFSDGSTQLWQASLDDTGHATYMTSSLAEGSHSITASYSGDTAFAASSGTVTETITTGAPIITWNTPGAITYGTALSATQLDATANVPGSFVYTPAAGTVLATGVQTLSVTFTPTDTTDYATATATVSLTVNAAAPTKVTPTITWNKPAAITYGTALSSTQLNATANVQGSFVYTPVAGTVLATGVQTLSVVFTPTDTIDYTTAAATVSLTVNAAAPTKVTPTITWNTPGAITYGTALSATQLDATANVPVSFVYTGSRHGAGSRCPDTLCHLYTNRHDRLHDGHGNSPTDREHGHDRTPGTDHHEPFASHGQCGVGGLCAYGQR